MIAQKTIKIRALVFLFSTLLIVQSVIGSVPSSRKSFFNDFSYTYSHSVNPKKILKNEYLWHETSTVPFSELIFSWNALRPQQGKFIFFVSILHQKWSSWIKVAEWGPNIQKSFSSKRDRFVTFRVAPITLKNKLYGKGFRVRVVSCDNANLRDVKYLFACASTPEKFKIISPRCSLDDILIDDIPRQSQMTLNHPHPIHLCSPTSTSVVINYLYKHILHQPYNYVNAATFAEEVRDQIFGVYGNSVLNVAAAFDALEGQIPCRVQRLNSFEQLHSYLKLNIPVVVSIHGPIRGGALPYRAGHLMVITGWDSESQSVVCMDPAFKSSKATETCYFIKDFLKAWARSRNLSYVFLPYGIA